MISGVSFQTKARTVDHLGREQIADTPTAVSELWKNSYDAYAREVGLNIYDGEQSVAVIADDGHGMNRDEFVNRWLVVGTESKAAADRTPISDRNGLRYRERQGQKGIGRLSCANLGSILLLVSKRRDQAYVAALVHWRLFENPFLNLADIQLPVAEFGSKDQILGQIPALASQLIGNVCGDETERGERIKAAWAAYDELHREEEEKGIATRLQPPSEEVLADIHATSFGERHLAQWKVWAGDSEHGTALLISSLNFDLQVELSDQVADTSAKAAKDRFFETLSSFVDPFVDPNHPDLNSRDPQFSYSVTAWRGQTARLILGSDKQFNRHMVDPMEHRIEGVVDEAGVFRGQIKAFGQWLPGEVVIQPPKDLEIPHRADTHTGPFAVYIASMEFTSANTTHTPAEFQHFQELAARYAGFMIFRDGLRVLPYGRTDNDFFEIESRRSKSAGREFWNHRQMFGRIAISRELNPNLKDKAGREGLLDNRAAKTLKSLVSNVLMQSARRYFGSASQIRSDLLPQIRESNQREKAAQARHQLRKRYRQEFRRQLQESSKALPMVAAGVTQLIQRFPLADAASIPAVQAELEELRSGLTALRLPEPPDELGTLEDQYADFRQQWAMAADELQASSERLILEMERLAPPRPRNFLEKQLSRNKAQLDGRIQSWRSEIEALQKAEFDRVRDLVKERGRMFPEEATPLLHRVETGELSFPEASKIMEQMRSRIDDDNANIFVPYIGALESLTESIDLEHLAVFGMEELRELRSELERLNSLAQLGIAVEIVGHELENYDDIIGMALNKLPSDLRSTKPVKDIEFGYEGLTQQLRFLSPLKLAGQRTNEWISGQDIFNYLREFFKLPLANNRIRFEATQSFLDFRVFDQKSRLFPVFINLVNNSIYWLSVQQNADRKILLTTINGDVVVSDNGPGVEAEDIPSLFSLFFTKKIRGGRGVGLYLSRANLAAAGHRISYSTESNTMPLSGANFVIEFRGAEFDGE